MPWDSLHPLLASSVLLWKGELLHSENRNSVLEDKISTVTNPLDSGRLARRRLSNTGRIATPKTDIHISFTASCLGCALASNAVRLTDMVGGWY